MSQLILYDLPSKGRCACWSLNPWKTRLALNFKGLDYKTAWVEYPDIAPTINAHVPPNPPGNAQFTIPTMKFGENDYVMDSKNIANRLERDHPSPSMHLDSPLLKQIEEMTPKALMPLRGVWMPLVPKNLLNERSREYFERTRQERFGMPLSELMEKEGGEDAWVKATPGLKELGDFIAKEGGPFVMGKTVSYADFVTAGWLQFYKMIDEPLFKRILEIHPSFGKLYDACGPWLERDAH